MSAPRRKGRAASRRRGPAGPAPGPPRVREAPAPVALEVLPAPPPQPEPGPEPSPAARPEPAGERPASLYDRFWATGLPKVWGIARREVGAFFVSPIGYVMAAVLVLIVTALSFLPRLANQQAISMAPLLNLVELLMVFIAPLYTMRLLAEERRAGTLEIVLTSPVRDWELVAGKWLGGFLCYLSTVAFTLVYAVLIAVQQPLKTDVGLLGLRWVMPNVDYGAIAAGYAGLVLLGAAWIAIGLLASSLTSNQIIAAVVGIAVLFFLYAAIAYLPIPLGLSGLADHLNANAQATAFSQGRIPLAGVVYFLSLTAGALFCATRVIESRRWR